MYWVNIFLFVGHIYLLTLNVRGKLYLLLMTKFLKFTIITLNLQSLAFKIIRLIIRSSSYFRYGFGTKRKLRQNPLIFTLKFLCISAFKRTSKQTGHYFYKNEITLTSYTCYTCKNLVSKKSYFNDNNTIVGM